MAAGRYHRSTRSSAVALWVSCRARTAPSTRPRARPCWPARFEVIGCVCTHNSSLSHFSTMMLLSHWHRHATEHASRRWREGRRDDSERMCRKFDLPVRAPESYHELQLADEAFAAAMRPAIARTLSHKLGAGAHRRARPVHKRPVRRVSDTHSTHWLIWPVRSSRNAITKRARRRPSSCANHEPADERLFQSTFARLGVGARLRGACEAASAVNTDGDALMRTVIREDPRSRGPGRPRVRRRGGVRRRREGTAFEGPALLNAEQVLEGIVGLVAAASAQRSS